MKGDNLGELEELVLLAVRTLAEDAYGVRVQRRIEKTTGRAVTMGAVYSALDRLEQKGLLRSQTRAGTAERGGRRRRTFEATATGRAALHESRAAREAMWALLGSSDA